MYSEKFFKKNAVFIQRPSDLTFLLEPYRSYKKEVFGVIAIDNQLRVISLKILFRGSENYCRISTKEIFRYLLTKKSIGFLCFHNHPSCNPEPSFDDLRTTQELTRIGKIIDIPLVDHLIVAGKTDYYSFLEHYSDSELLKVADNWRG